MAASHFGVSIAIEIGFVDNAFRLDDATHGVLDTSLLHPDWAWTDITSYVQRFSTNIGRQRSLERFSAGTATLTLNDTEDRRFDPTNTAGAYYPNVKPGRPIRIRATHGVTTYDLWWGFIDSWDPSYLKGNPGGTTVELEATDAFKRFAAIKPPQVPVQGSGERSGVRVNRILDHADWPRSMATVEAGTVNLIGTALTENTLDELAVTMFSEGGAVYQNGAGTVVFEDRNHLFSAPRSLSSQATFGDGAGEIGYFGVELAYDDELVKNDVTLTTAPGKTIRRANTESQATYGVRTYEVTGLVNQNVGDLQGLADMLIALNTDAELRFDSITLRPQRNAAVMWPQVLGRLIHDRITVKRRPAGGGSPISLDCFVEGVSHKADANGVWESELFLSAAKDDIFFTSPLLLDDATFGVLESTNVLGF